MSLSRLMLGCAKFGLDNYPPGSAHSRPSRQESIALIRHAYDRGIRAFDTAAAYGDAEAILADALEDRPAHVTTKRAPERFTRHPKWITLLHNPLTHFPAADGVSLGGWGPADDLQVADWCLDVMTGFRHLQVPYWFGYRCLYSAMEDAQSGCMTVYARQPYGRGTLVSREALWFSLASPADYVVVGAANREQLDQTLEWAASFPTESVILASVCTRR